ncbi:FG-GAP repeat domain-containing protein [Melioribacter sp. Ez-97]|uniref:FG-GAP repeat domain-containing protein n=1 Tax=Melioribacter sp. Ez-97 TaxID=3423434 RepID=UPI003EDB3C25
MNKNATKKLFKGASKDSIPLNIFLVLLFFASSLSAQIPINGFCKTEVLFDGFRENAEIFPDKIIPADLDSDGSYEFVLLKNNKNLMAVVSGNKHRMFNVGQTINDLEFHGSTKNSNVFCWLSRKNRNIGFITVSKNGIISRKKIKKFDDIPSRITCVDLDNDGFKEIIVSGYAFEGLTLVNAEKNNYAFSQITDERVFPLIANADFDYDGYNDLVAYDIFANRLVFFYNNQELSFSESRKIELSDYPEDLIVSDINSDGFTDLLISYGDRLSVFVGDTVSSFLNKFEIELPVKSDILNVSDFNGDGIEDLLTASYSEGEVYLIYGKGGSEFYEPLPVYKDRNLVDLAVYKEKGSSKLALLLRNGKIVVISKINKFANADITSFGAEALSLGFVPGEHNIPEAFFYIDKNSNNLILTTLSKALIPDALYRYPLQNSYSIVKSVKRKNKIDFYLYNPNTSLIEILRLDSFRPTRRILYTKGRIKDLLLFNDRLEDRQRIYALTQNKSSLLLETYDYRDFRFVRSGADSAGADVLAAALEYETYPAVYSLINKNDSLFLVKKDIKRFAAMADSVYLGAYNLSDLTKIYLEIYNDPESNLSIAAAILTEGDNAKFVLLANDKIVAREFKNTRPVERAFQFKKKGNRLEVFFVDAVKNILRKIVLTDNFKTVETGTVLDSDTVNNYISIPFKNNSDLILYAPGSDKNIIKLRILR